MAENEGGKKGKGGKEGKGGGGGGAKPKLPELLKSDDFTGQYKEGTVVLRTDMPDPYQQAYNKAWIVSLMYSNLCSIFTMRIQLQF